MANGNGNGTQKILFVALSILVSCLFGAGGIILKLYDGRITEVENDAEKCVAFETWKTYQEEKLAEVSRKLDWLLKINEYRRLGLRPPDGYQGMDDDIGNGPRGGGG